MNQQTGKYIIIAGVVLVAVGVAVYLFGSKLHWFGRLPGDVRIEKENFKLYFPLVSMLLVSLLITIILNVIRRW